MKKIILLFVAFTVAITTLYAIPIPIPANTPYVTYRTATGTLLRADVSEKPAADKTPADIRAVLCPIRFEICAPNRPPTQKNVIASVKLSASSDAPQPNSAANGDLSIDHAYRMPANSMATTPTAI
jgi:hypothetical protein